jgi:hypothetical protein
MEERRPAPDPPPRLLTRDPGQPAGLVAELDAAARLGSERK